MTISTLPTPPSRSDSSTFAANADAFLGALPTFATEANALADQLNSIGVGTYSATSTTPLTIATGTQSLTIEPGKSFTVGQAVSIALTASPTNYMVGQVAAYDAATGAMTVNVTAFNGSGTAAEWTVSIGALVAGGGVSPDSIVALTSGTSWTCPAGATKARLRIGGAGGGAKGGSASSGYGSGPSGGYLEAIITVSPGTSYTYAIGAGGVGGGAANAHGSNGGATTFAANGVTFTCGGGIAYKSITGASEGGAATGAGAFTVPGALGPTTTSGTFLGPSNLMGRSGGASRIGAPGADGDSGLIVLELYK